MKAALVLAALALAPLAHAAGVLLLDASGELTVGTAGVGIGALPASSTPVSVASHPFSWTDCARELLISFAYASQVAAPDEKERALMQIEIRKLSGQLVGSWLAADGSVIAATEPLAAAEYRLRVFHLVGGPVAYRATIEGYAAEC